MKPELYPKITKLGRLILASGRTGFKVELNSDFPLTRAAVMAGTGRMDIPVHTATAFYKVSEEELVCSGFNYLDQNNLIKSDPTIYKTEVTEEFLDLSILMLTDKLRKQFADEFVKEAVDKKFEELGLV